MRTLPAGAVLGFASNGILPGLRGSTTAQMRCSARRSQALRARKWGEGHPHKNRAIRRNQYQKSTAAKLLGGRVFSIEVG
jgi:hypothetical protein